MVNVKLSSVILVVVFSALLVALVVLRQSIYDAHIDESINYFSSDGSVYFSFYSDLKVGWDEFDDYRYLLNLSPVVLMMLFDGDLFKVQVMNLILMFLTMRMAFGCFRTFDGKMVFMLGCLFFPYFVLGFVGLNKEVYAMCSAIFFCGYLTKGRLSLLVISLFLAACARYYMVASILMLAFVIPRHGRPRWGLILLAMIAITIAAPVIRIYIPQYAYGDLVNDTTSGVLFDQIISNYGYIAVYPIKYIVLVVTRPYAYLIGSTHDAIGAIVSLLSLLALGIGAWLWASGKQLEPVVKGLIVAGMIAPIPMLWSEIMHWRYHSYVYFFFLFAIVLYQESRWRDAREVKARGSDVPAAVDPAGVAIGPEVSSI